MASYRPRSPSSPVFEALRRRLEALIPLLNGPFSWAGIALTMLAAAAFATRPLAWSLGSQVLDPLQSLQDTWIMAWGAKALGTDPALLFEAPIFHPASNALAFGEAMLGNLLLFAPLYALSEDPFWASGAFTLLAIALTAFSTFILAFHWTRSRIAGLVSALLMALSPIFLAQANHLSLLGLWWSPLALWMTSRFLRHGRWRDVLLGAAFLVAQFASSLDLGYFLLVILVAYAGTRVLLDPELRRRDRALKGAAAAALAGALLLPLALPYIRLREAWGLETSLHELAMRGADVLAILTAWPGSILYGGWLQASADGASLFPGLLALGGVGIALTWAWKHRSELLAREALAVAAAGAIAAILSLGPALKLGGMLTVIPLPYALLYLTLPGFSSIHDPALFGLMLALALALLAGFAVQIVEKRWAAAPPRRAALLALALGLVMLDTLAHPLTLHPRPVADELDTFLARRAEGPILTLPLPTQQREPEKREEAERMVAALTHGLPMVNGTSEIIPGSYRELARRIERGPDPALFDALTALGVKTLVIRLDQMPQGQREDWSFARDPSALGLVPLWFDEGKTAVYLLAREPKPADLLSSTLLLPERLPAGWDFTMGLALDVPAGTVWTAPQPPERQPLTIRWEGPAQNTQVTRPVWLPLTVQGPESVGIPLRTPARPGQYQVTVEGASLKATASVEVASWKAIDSLAAPLDAKITWQKPQPSDKIVPGAVLPLRWEVTNQGENVWRARTSWRQRLAAHPEWLRENPRRLFDAGVGEIMLEVRWLKRRTGVEVSEGQARLRRYPLRHDVFPGQRILFDEMLVVPSEPGGYWLELRLTDAFGTVSTPVERREVLVHELAGLRDFLKRFEGR